MNYELTQIIDVERPDGTPVERIARVVSASRVIRKGFPPGTSDADIESGMVLYLGSRDEAAELDASGFEVSSAVAKEGIPAPQKFTPRQVYLGFIDLIGKQQTIDALNGLPDDEKWEFQTASSIDEDDPKLNKWLTAFGHTIDDLKQAVR